MSGEWNCWKSSSVDLKGFDVARVQHELICTEKRVVGDLENDERKWCESEWKSRTRCEAFADSFFFVSVRKVEKGWVELREQCDSHHCYNRWILFAVNFLHNRQQQQNRQWGWIYLRTSESRRAWMPFCSLSSLNCKSDFSFSRILNSLLYFREVFSLTSMKLSRSASIKRYCVEMRE